MLSLELQGVDAAADRLAGLAPAMRAALQDKLQRWSDAAAAKLRDELSGPMLRSRSGRLRDTVSADLTSAGDTVSAELTLGEDLPYARIQIQGGQIAAREIIARNVQALRFMIDGRPVFARAVRLPSVTIPAHPVLEAAWADLAPEIEADLAEASGAGAS